MLDRTTVALKASFAAPEIKVIAIGTAVACLLMPHGFLVGAMLTAWLVTTREDTPTEPDLAQVVSSVVLVGMALGVLLLPSLFRAVEASGVFRWPASAACASQSIWPTTVPWIATGDKAYRAACGIHVWYGVVVPTLVFVCIAAIAGFRRGPPTSQTDLCKHLASWTIVAAVGLYIMIAHVAYTTGAWPDNRLTSNAGERLLYERQGSLLSIRTLVVWVFIHIASVGAAACAFSLNPRSKE